MGTKAETNVPREDPNLVANSEASRVALQFFQKYEQYEVQEMLAQTGYHWFLSQEEHRLHVEPPLGMVMEMQPFSEEHCVLVMPMADSLDGPDLREVHQIIRELVVGLYALNQVPSISLEANFDLSTSCLMPPAYNDTRVGQLLVDIDYTMKALWHGAYFPRDKRLKFSEKWRSSLNVNPLGVAETKKTILAEFTIAGMIDVTKDPDYTTIYDDMRLFPMSKKDADLDKRLFMQHTDSMGLVQTWRQSAASQSGNLFLIQADSEVAGIIRPKEPRLNRDIFERLQTRLQAHVDVIQRNLGNKEGTRRSMESMKLVSFLVPFLIGMRRRNKIPDMKQFLPPFPADDCKTERELPPLILSDDFRCPNFDFGGQYFHLHGGVQIDIESDPVSPLPADVASISAEIREEAVEHLRRISDSGFAYQESYPLPTRKIGGERYCFFAICFETFYRVSPARPSWVHAFYEKIKELKLKRLPLTDLQMHEQFKRRYNYKQAIKYKHQYTGLKKSAVRGMCSVFYTLARKSASSQLGKQDDDGYSLAHQAAQYNRPRILQLLVGQGQDLNVRRFHLMSSVGTTPLHLAAKTGSLEAAICILSNHADILLCDKSGWSAIHHAAFYNHTPIIRMIIRRAPDLLEFPTMDGESQTPLLMACSSGALESVQLLIELGAKISSKDHRRNNMIHLAALRFHTNVLEYFIEWNNPEVPVWQTLVEMLNSEDFMKRDSAVRSLEILTTSNPQHSQSIMDADGIPALVNIMSMRQPEMQSLGAAVLCNMTNDNPSVCHLIAGSEAVSTLVHLLGSHTDDVQSRVSIILADLARYEDNKTLIAQRGGIPPLIHLLNSDLEDVLVNVVTAIEVLCRDHHDNQTLVAENGGIEPLAEFLEINSGLLQAASAAALATVTRNHRQNQDHVIAIDAARPLVNLLKLRNVEVQVKAAAALESLAENNAGSQRAILDLGAPTLLIRLLKVWAIEVKEQAASTLWALAGDTRPQQRMIAECIGIGGIIDLIVKSEKLKYVGCKATIALTRNSFENQNRVKSENGISPLVRILRSSKTSERVLLKDIQALGTLCLGVANRNNKVTQDKIADEGAITCLVQLLVSCDNEPIRVEIALTLSCIVLGNKRNQELLLRERTFRFKLLMDLLYSSDKAVQLKAGSALAKFAFNNTAQQYAIREAGGIRMSAFQRFLGSENEEYKAHAAFQIVILAKVIVDKDQVSLSAEGVTALVGMLNSEMDETLILSGGLIASLAHTRAGIPDIIVTSGAMELLIRHLSSENMEVRSAAAVALGYLTYNRTATRLLLVATRNTPGLYERLTANLDQDAKISKDFTDEFRRQQLVGLPALSTKLMDRQVRLFGVHGFKIKSNREGDHTVRAPSLEKHGGPSPYSRGKSAMGSRPHTSCGMYSQKSRIAHQRSVSAPAIRRQKGCLKPAVRGTEVISTGGDDGVQRRKTETKVVWD